MKHVPFIPSLRLAVFLVFAALVFGAGSAYGDWQLVWSDNFNLPDGSSPNSTNWTYDIGAGGWGNNELEYYTSRTNNARIQGGQLVIEADQESYDGSSYTSARMKTQGLWTWTYGRIEASIKIPKGQGIWPAFWMLGANINSVGWPTCGEMDIMENIGKTSDQGTDHCTVHGPANGGDYNGGEGITATYTLPNGALLSDDFHVYAVEWTTNQIQFFLDSNLVSTVTPANVAAIGGTWVFTAPQFIILNIAVGGNWPGDPDGTTVFPQQMLVQYVNVYSYVASSSAPSAPTGLSASPGNTQVVLNWSASTGATGYNVKRSTTSGAETNLASTTSTSYTDTSVVNGTEYYYVVTATNSYGTSGNSTEVSATPPVPPAAGTVLVDFDSGASGDVTPSPDADGLYWNNITAAQTGSGAVQLNSSLSPVALVNLANANSGWTLAVTNLSGWNASSAANWEDYGGPYPSAINNFPSTALCDGLGISGSGVSVTLSGLNPGSTYNLLTYGGLNYQFGLTTNTLIVGTSSSPASVVFNSQDNATTVVQWTGIAPNASGEIVFTVAGNAALNFVELSPATVSSNPPPTPTGLGATAGNRQVALTWTASSGATSYNVKRSTTSGAETTIANVMGASFTDTNVVNGTTYYYKVSAVNTYGESTNSLEVSATPQAQPPSMPTGLSATGGNGQVALTWLASLGATSYNVKRSTTSGAEATITNVTGTNYTDTQVVNGTTYYYKVSATNASGESANSTEVYATPQAQQQQSAGPTALMNFADAGSSYFMASPDANGHYWNNITSVANPGKSVAPLNGVSAPLALTNTAGTLSGWTLTVSNIGANSYGDNFGGDASTGSGPFSSALTNVFPVTALEDGITIGNAGNPKISVTFSNLTTSQTYDVLLFGAVNNFNGNLQTNTLVFGSSTSPATVIFNALNNTTTLAEWDNITPGAGGQIIFTVGCAGQGALSCMELVQNTPASVGSISRGAMIGNSLTLNWTANANVTLQSATNLTPPVVWTDVPNTTGQGSATITTTNTRMFFRLSQ